MKTLYAKLFLMLTLALSPLLTYGQQQNEKVTIDKSLLTKDQIQQIEAKAAQEKIERYGKWVGVGHEVGTAVNESLTAITQQANNFAETKVGKATMFVVIWKVAGHDLLGFLIGFAMIIIMLPIWLWSYRKFLPHRVLVGETFDPEKTTLFGRPKVAKRDYKIVNDVDDRNADNVHGYLIAHYVFLAILFVVTMIVMFA